MNTIFLNIDYLLLCPKNEEIEKGVNWLNQLYQEYPFQLVLISSIKMNSEQFESMKELFYQVGLIEIPIVDYLISYSKENKKESMGKAIATYLLKHPNIFQCVIIHPTNDVKPLDWILVSRDLWTDFDDETFQMVRRLEIEMGVEKQKVKKYRHFEKES